MLLRPRHGSLNKKFKIWSSAVKIKVEFALADWNISKALAICLVVDPKLVLLCRIQSQQQGRSSTLSRFHHFSALLWLWRSCLIVGKAASRSFAVGRWRGIAKSLWRKIWSLNHLEVNWLKVECARNGILKGEFTGGFVKFRKVNSCFIFWRAWDRSGSSRCAANLSKE